MLIKNAGIDLTPVLNRHLFKTLAKEIEALVFIKGFTVITYIALYILKYFLSVLKATTRV